MITAYWEKSRGGAMDNRFDFADLMGMEQKELQVLTIQMVLELCSQVKSQNGRVRKLEDWRSYLTGAIAVLSFVVVLVGKELLGKV